MLGNKELEDRISILENLVAELTDRLDDSDEAIDEIQTTVDESQEFANDIQHGEAPFQVHWIKIDETESFNSCDEVDDLDKAKIAFKEAAKKRDESSTFRPVHQGDVMVLMCDTAPEPEPPSGGGTPPDVPACYYIGMCAKVDHTTQLEVPANLKNLGITESQESDSNKPYREFFAWSSCGGEGGSLECDRDEEYVTVVTASKVEVASTGTNPKIHTIQSFEKTRELQFDECGTLVSVGIESAWTAVGASHQINECCDSGSGGSGGSSTQTECVTDSWAATVQIETLKADGTQFDMSTATLNVDFCHYRRNSQPVLSKTAGVWTFSSPFGHGDFTNNTLTGNYTAPAGSAMSVTVS